MKASRTIPWDWYPGVIPSNVEMADGSFVDTSYSFSLYRSERETGVVLGVGAGIYEGAIFDVGPRGHVRVGAFACLNGARVICNSQVEIGDYALLSWKVVVMDTWRLPFDAAARRSELERAAARPTRYLDADVESRPVSIGRNAWIGFGACVLPGVTVGEGSIVGAMSVITSDVPPYTVVAGNPARVVRTLTPPDPPEGAPHGA